ncbi:hypothetical protein U3516DRAFT_739779 [Neocallimastix sp. 'constans']
MKEKLHFWNINKNKDAEYGFPKAKIPILGLIYILGMKNFKVLAKLISRNTFCYVNGFAYPLIKVSYFQINEQILNSTILVLNIIKLTKKNRVSSKNFRKINNK